MVALKNLSSITNPVESETDKSVFQEPEGMIEIDLKNVVSEEPAKDENKLIYNTSVFKRLKTISKYLHYTLISLFLLIVVVLIVRFSIWSKSSNSAPLHYAKQSSDVTQVDVYLNLFKLFYNNSGSKLKREVFHTTKPSLELESDQNSSNSNVIVDDFGAQEVFIKKHKREVSRENKKEWSSDTQDVYSGSSLPGDKDSDSSVDITNSRKEQLTVKTATDASKLSTTVTKMDTHLTKTTTVTETTTPVTESTTVADTTTTITESTTAAETTTPLAKNTIVTETTTSIPESTTVAETTIPFAESTTEAKTTTPVSESTTVAETTTPVTESTTVAETTTHVTESTTVAETTTPVTESTTVAETNTPVTESTTVTETTTSVTESPTVAKTTTPVTESTTVAETTTPVTESTTVAETTTTVTESTTVAETTTPVTKSTTVAETTTPVTESTTVAETTTPVTESTTVAETTTPVTESTTVAETTTPVTENTTVAETTTPVTESTTVAETTTPVTESTTVAKTTTPVTESTTVAETTTPVTESTTVAETTTPVTESTTVAKTTTPNTENYSSYDQENIKNNAHNELLNILPGLHGKKIFNKYKNFMEFAKTKTSTESFRVSSKHGSSHENINKDLRKSFSAVKELKAASEENVTNQSLHAREKIESKNETILTKSLESFSDLQKATFSSEHLDVLQNSTEPSIFDSAQSISESGIINSDSHKVAAETSKYRLHNKSASSLEENRSDIVSESSIGDEKSTTSSYDTVIPDQLANTDEVSTYPNSDLKTTTKSPSLTDNSWDPFEEPTSLETPNIFNENKNFTENPETVAAIDTSIESSQYKNSEDNSNEDDKESLSAGSTWLNIPQNIDTKNVNEIIISTELSSSPELNKISTTELSDAFLHSTLATIVENTENTLGSGNPNHDSVNVTSTEAAEIISESPTDAKAIATTSTEKKFSEQSDNKFSNYSNSNTISTTKEETEHPPLTEEISSETKNTFSENTETTTSIESFINSSKHRSSSDNDNKDIGESSSASEELKDGDTVNIAARPNMENEDSLPTNLSVPPEKSFYSTSVPVTNTEVSTAESTTVEIESSSTTIGDGYQTSTQSDNGKKELTTTPVSSSTTIDDDYLTSASSNSFAQTPSVDTYNLKEPTPIINSETGSLRNTKNVLNDSLVLGRRDDILLQEADFSGTHESSLKKDLPSENYTTIAVISQGTESPNDSNENLSPNLMFPNEELNKKPYKSFDFENEIISRDGSTTLAPKNLASEEDEIKSIDHERLMKERSQKYLDLEKGEGDENSKSSEYGFPAYFPNKDSFKRTQTRVNWPDQNSIFKDTRAKEPDFSQGNNPIHTNQQTSIDFSNNFNKPVCPPFTILQQSNPLPFAYPTSPIVPYQTGLQYPYSMPPMSPYPYQSFPQFYPNPPVQQNPFFGAQSVGRNGQFFVCSPIPSTIDNQFTGFEIRKRVENMNLQQRLNTDLLDDSSEERRSARDCPFDQISCNDGLKCIKETHFCDGEVHCKDASDELDCTCKARIDKSRLCDGYFDCPNGEDELSCFGCDEDSFSCDDWSVDDRTASCIPMEQRCDGIRHCPTGKDEEKCSILTNNFSVGFLYRNYKGKWYPACYYPELWASEACKVDAGPSSIPPLTHRVRVNFDYSGPYASMSQQGQANIGEKCETNVAIYVECPAPVCGTRISMRNPYRREEVDTSVEQILSRFSKNEKKYFVKNSTDGEDSILGDGRVVGGKPCQPESWPWIVSVYRNGVFHCGGVLINANWIVTAAHCVDKYWHYYYEIQAGVLRRYSYAPMVQNRMISHIIAHQYYDRSKLKNDIALMKLETPVEFNRYIRPACLPSEMTAGVNYMWNPKAGTICSAIGWGAMVEHGSDPDHLREVEVPVLKNCKHREDKEGHEICAGLAEGGKDACQGDSGGPFMCRNPNVPNQWYLAGVVSHGEGCARPNEPGVYTRVSLYLEWIYENTRSQLLPQTLPLHRCPGFICNGTKRCLPKKRHCDKIVDCLLADDEVGCDSNYFNEIFKHAMRHMFFRSEQDSDKNTTLVTNQPKDDDDDDDEDEGFMLQQPAPTTDISIDSTTRVEIGQIETTEFICKNIAQKISIEKKCDKKIDCEDGTDEEDCLCVDYVKLSHPDVICDGLVDCYDYSDEKNCFNCQLGEFYCKHNKTCISNTQRCDGIPHCLMEEDELDCFALTDGKTIELDADARPILNNSGIVTFNRNGTWEVICDHLNSTEASYASHLCLYLGFSEHKRFLEVVVKAKKLKVVQNGTTIVESESQNSNTCSSLYVKCSNGLDVDYRANDVIPWNAEIYINGHYKCMGTLIEHQWVVTSSTCFEENFKLVNSYVAVLLGGRKTFLDVMGSYEDIIRVIEYMQIPNTDISLLRLERNATLSRYIQPLKINVKKNYNVNEKQTCMAVGKDKENHMEIVNLSVIRNCTEGYRCFVRSDALNKSCESDNHWIGTIVCRSTKGWYPNAVYYSTAGSCGFARKNLYYSIQYWKGSILRIFKQTTFAVYPPRCDGFRCDLGNCIDFHRICDGIPDCKSRNDEEPKFCLEKQTTCNNSLSCVCKPSEIKCKNGKCVPKSKFCNIINDCGDSSDEPIDCNCKSYLELTKPEKICDGIRNCEDRSDEDPYSCQCKENMYKCGESNHCVSQDVVCDKVSDCPNNDDEMNCLAFVSSPNLPNEVQTRTAGVWHPGCFPKHITTLELENICFKMGYTGGSATRINPYNESVAKISWSPVTDEFLTIRLKSDEDNKISFGFRTGEKPFATLKPNNDCYRLFLQCL